MIGFIGFGHVGKALGTHLRALGAGDIGYFDPFVHAGADHIEDRQFLIRMASVDELVKACNIIFITVADDAIENVAEGITFLEGLQEKLFIHTSGAHTVEDLAALEAKGAHVASVHPLMAFNDHASAVKSLSNCYLTVESKGQSPALESLLNTLGNPVLRLESAQKAKYHAGACVVSNYLTTVLAYGAELVREATDGTSGAVWASLRPLVDSALDNIETLGVENAMTGPLKRQDAKTIAMHYDAIRKDRSAHFYHQLVAQTLDYMDQHEYPSDRLAPLKKEATVEEAFGAVLQSVPLAFDGRALQFDPALTKCQLMTFVEAVHIPAHRHGAQLGVVLEGSICIINEGVRHYYVKGDVFAIPAGQIHESYIEAGYKDISIFESAERYGG